MAATVAGAGMGTHRALAGLWLAADVPWQGRRPPCGAFHRSCMRPAPRAEALWNHAVAVLAALAVVRRDFERKLQTEIAGEEAQSKKA